MELAEIPLSLISVQEQAAEKAAACEAETARVRKAIREALAGIDSPIPREKLAKIVMVEAVDHGLAGCPPMQVIGWTREIGGLLAGRWNEDSKIALIEKEI